MICTVTDGWLPGYVPTADTYGKGIYQESVAIVAPGFSADCLETLEELNGENREIFMHNGGEEFAYLPCLNDSDDGMSVINHIVERELQGWI